MTPHRTAILIKYDIHYDILGTCSDIECSTKLSYHTNIVWLYDVSQILHVQNYVIVHCKQQNSLQVWAVIFNSVWNKNYC